MASTKSLDVTKKITKSTNRKPSIPVRQTKTSKIRSELGNKLKLQYLKKNLPKLKESMPVTSRSDIASCGGNFKCNTFKKPMNLDIINHKSFVSRSTKIISRTNLALKSTSTSNLPSFNNRNILIKTAQSKSKQNESKTVKIQHLLPKSFSSLNLKRTSKRNTNTVICKSYSADNIFETIEENESQELPYFKTPMAKRRSVFNLTPMTIPSPWSGCWLPTVHDLKRSLSVWMEENGKPSHSFSHLRCFGMNHLPAAEEDKENVLVDLLPKADKQKKNISVPLKAMKDVYDLILEGYPGQQCNAWLDVIRTSFEEIEDEKQYWECIGALDKARVEECYTYDENDANFEDMLQKFNVLNLTPSTCTQRKQK